MRKRQRDTSKGTDGQIVSSIMGASHEVNVTVHEPAHTLPHGVTYSKPISPNIHNRQTDRRTHTWLVCIEQIHTHSYIGQKPTCLGEQSLSDFPRGRVNIHTHTLRQRHTHLQACYNNSAILTVGNLHKQKSYL